MKKIAVIVISVFSVSSCKTKIDPDTLAKDIALRPAHLNPVEEERAKLASSRKEIDSVIGREVCTDAALWRITPIGVKSCGGPAEFTAYPIKNEAEILPKIQNYTEQTAAFYRKYKIISDCSVVPAPKEVTCENGKAVLIRDYGNSAK